MNAPRWIRRGSSMLGPAPLRRPATLGSRRALAMAALATVLVAGLLAGWGHANQSAPRALADVQLVGARGPACLRLVVAQDVSGSMAGFAAPRSRAVDQLIAWAPGNLRQDDQLVVLDFAATTGTTWGPTAIPELASSSRPRSGAPDGRDTLLAPVLTAVTGLPATRCDTLLVMVSDGQLADLPADATAGNAKLATSGVHDLRLLVPSRNITVPQAWSTAFPAAAPVVFDGNDAGATGLAMAQAIAGTTGQQVRHR